MDLSERGNILRDLNFPPPSPPPTPIFHHASSTGTNFPIIAVAVIGILATAFLLVSYYVFVIKCCLNWHRIDILGRFSLSRRRRNDQDPLMVYSPELRNRGLDESVIRAIPIFKFKKRREGDEKNDSVFTGEGEGEENTSQECSVCLNEFQEEEKLRIIPHCCHLFHIDCIDIWLQNNANCPLCRTRVSCDTSFPPERVSAPSTSPDNTVFGSDNVVVRGENEYVVIELGMRNVNSTSSDRDSLRNGRVVVVQERSNSGHLLTETPQNSISQSPVKLDRGGFQRKGRKLHKVTSMGDECINIRRDKDEQFGSVVQPIRRSISMDSSADRQLYLAVQEAIFQKNQEIQAVGDGGGCSSSSGNVSNYRVKRSFFSFGSSRRSRSSSILPLYFEP